MVANGGRDAIGVRLLGAEKFDLFDRPCDIGKGIMVSLGSFDPQLKNNPKFLEGLFDRFSLSKTAFECGNFGNETSFFAGINYDWVVHSSAPYSLINSRTRLM